MEDSIFTLEVMDLLSEGIVPRVVTLALKKGVDDAAWLDPNQFVDPLLTDLKALGLLCDGNLRGVLVICNLVIFE